MIVLGAIKWCAGYDPGGKIAFEMRDQIFARCISRFAFSHTGWEDRRAIAFALVTKLALGIEGIDIAPENRKQV